MAPPARTQEWRRVVAGLWTIGLSSMVLSAMWVSRADANGTTVPAVFTKHVAAAPTTVPPTTVPPTTTTTAPPPPPTTVPPPPPPPPPASAPASPPPGWGCGAAMAYLAAHEAPGFSSSCPGPNDGHQATTTAYYSNGDVTGTIGIEVPCPAAYMNEAHNSWVLRSRYLGTPIPDGLGDVIDPYGYCH